MPAFPKPAPDLPASLDGFRIGAQIHDDGTAITVELTFSVAIISTTGRTHQATGDLTKFLAPAQITAFTNAALPLYAQAKLDLLT